MPRFHSYTGPRRAYQQESTRETPREKYDLDLKVGDILLIQDGSGGLEIELVDIKKNGTARVNCNYHGSSETVSLAAGLGLCRGPYNIYNSRKNGQRIHAAITLPRGQRYRRTKGPNWNSHQ